MTKKTERYFFLILITIFFFTTTVFAQQITKGPFIAEPSQHSITIRWESSVKTNFNVEYGKSESYRQTQTATVTGQKNQKFLYECKLNNLKSGKRYFYRLKTGGQIFPGSTFYLPDNESPLTFCVLGDSRSKPHIFSAILKLIDKTEPAAIIANGDLVAKGGSEENWDSQYFSPTASVINHIPFLSAVGDHESDRVDGDSAKMFTYYLYPHKNNSELWFSYDIGNSHFIFLDWRHPNNQAMIDWFKNDVNKSDKKWKFVTLHRSPYNLGGHHVSWGKNIWPDLFQKYQIDVVFAGHSHLYERFYPVKPENPGEHWAVTYITTGGAGASLAEPNEHPALAFSESVNHFLKVTTDKKQIKIYTIKDDGMIIDSVAWEKHANVISDEYLAGAFSKEEMDVVNIFNSPLSERIGGLPMVHVPYKPVLNLDGSNIRTKVEYTIRLADESEGKYLMEPVKGVLNPGEKQNVLLKIYSRTTMTVSKWGGLSPTLRLVTEYKTNTFSGTISGGRLEYIAY